MKKYLFLILLTAAFFSAVLFAEAEKTDGKPAENNATHLQWSNISKEKLDWKGALDYCKNVSDGGFKDWRLPNIDELRDSVVNCPKTEFGGECKVSEKSGCLSPECKNPKGSCNCKRQNYAVYSKFLDGEHIGLWSSSALSNDANSVWGIVYYSAMVGSIGKNSKLYARCVRTADASDKRVYLGGDLPVIMGALDRSDIDAYIRRNLAKIVLCYEKELNKDPKVEGRIIVNFIVSATGDVSSAKVHKSNVANLQLETCVVEQIKKIKFPKPKGGGIVIVNYPFVFKNGDK